MKKILSFIFLFFILILPVKGEETSDTYWSTEIINDSHTELIKTERRYKWYHEEIIYSSDYYIEGDNPLEYPNKVTNDYIETPFSNWYDDYISSSKPGRYIETRSVSKYRLLKPIRYILFKNIMGGFTNLFMTELNILINNSEIDYQLECIGCYDGFEKYLKDDNIYVPGTYIENNGSLKIDLGSYYDVSQIKIELYMYDSVPNTKTFDIYMNEGGTLEEHSSIRKHVDIYSVSQNYEAPDRYIIFPDYDWLDNPVYNDWIYTTNFYNNTYYRQMVIANEYRYKDIKYRYSGVKKEYLDDYYTDYDDPYYQKDINEYQDYYLYHIKDEYHEDNTNQEEEDNDPTINDPPSDEQTNENTNNNTNNNDNNSNNNSNSNSNNNLSLNNNDNKETETREIIYIPSNIPKDIDGIKNEEPKITENNKNVIKHDKTLFVNKKSIVIILMLLWSLILAGIVLLIGLWKKKKSVV